MNKSKKAPKKISKKNTPGNEKAKKPEKNLQKQPAGKKSPEKKPGKNLKPASKEEIIKLPGNPLKFKNIKYSKIETKKYFDILPVITVVLNRKGNVLLINPKGCELLGYTEEELIGKNWFEIVIPEPEQKEISGVFKKIISGKITSKEYYENHLIRKDRTELMIAWRNSIIKDESDTITGIISSGIDITERKKSEQELLSWIERYEIISDMSGQVIYNNEIVSGKISWSGKIKQVLGYTKEEMGDINEWAEKIHPGDRTGALRLLEIAEKSTGNYDVEYRFRHKNGNYRLMLDKGIFIPGNNGKAINMVGTMQDITEKKETENALVESEKKYRTLFKNVTSAFALHEIICDKKGKPIDYKFLEVNPAFESLFKVSAKDLVGKTGKHTLPALDKFFIDTFCKVALTGKEISIERYIADIDKYIIFHAFSPKKNQFAILFSDFTKIVKQQKELKEKEEFLRGFINAVGDPMFMIDEEGIAIYVNKAIAENFNMTPEELVGKNVYDLIPEDIALQRKKYNSRVFKTGKNLNYEDERNGEFFNNIIYPVFDEEGKVKNIAIVSSDITEKKKAESLLLENQNRLSETEKFSLVMVTYSDLDGRWIKVPPSLCNFLGYREEELLEGNFRDITHPEDVETEWNECRRLIEGSKKSFEMEKRYIKKDKSIVWVYINCSIVVDKKNNPVHFIKYIKDITDRKNAENALKKNEELLRKITETASDAIVLLDNNGMVKYWNTAAEKMFGYSEKEMLGKELHKILAPVEYMDNYRKGFEHFVRTGRGKAIDRTTEFTAIRKNGNKFPIEVSASPLMIDGMWHATGFIRDITERKKSEEMIKSSLEEKEILLREVHHRVKNNLQVISSLLSIQADKTENEDNRAVFRKSQHRIKSIAKVHERLYQTKSISEIDFNEYVSSLTEELITAYGELAENISLRTDIEDVILGIDYAVPCGLIINEAVSNSLNYAFPGNMSGERKCEIFIKMSLKDDGNFELIIGDNGIGLPEENHSDIKGNLGLNLIKILVVSQLKGDLKIEKDNGTKFTINFKPSAVPNEKNIHG